MTAAFAAVRAPSPDLHPIARGLRVNALLALEAASLAMALWLVWHWSELPAYVGANRILPAARNSLIIAMLGSAAGTCLLALGYRLGAGAGGAERVGRIARWLAPLAVIGLLPLLLHLRVWLGRDLLFLLLTVAATFGLRAALLAHFSGPGLAVRRPAWPALRPPALGAWAPALTVWLGILAFTVYFSWITIANHHNLRTASFDLGLENNVVWNIVNGGFWFKVSPLGGPTSSHFGIHTTFFSYLIGLVYRFAQRPETLLVVQAALVAAAALPLYLLALKRFAPWPAAALALIYLLYPPLHGSILYDFHYQPLAPFFLWMALWAVESRRVLLAILFALLSLSLREDIGVLLASLGAYLVLTGHHPRAGALLAIAGASCFVVLKLLVMPRFIDGVEFFVHQYQGLLGPGEKGFLGILKTVLGNPSFTMQTLLERDKLVYLLQIMAPLVFLPLARPAGLLLCVPGFIFTLMSTGYAPLYQVSFQYTAYWTSCIFIGLLSHLAAVRQPRALDDTAGLRRQRAWLIALVAAAIITSHQYGAVLQREHVRAGFGLFQFGSTEQDRKRYAALRDLIGRMPPLAKVAASENLVPHVSSRPDAYTLRTGLFDAEYLLFTTPIRDDERRFVADALTSGEFGVITGQEGFVLARRGHGTHLNARVLARL